VRRGWQHEAAESAEGSFGAPLGDLAVQSLHRMLSTLAHAVGPLVLNLARGLLLNAGRGGQHEVPFVVYPVPVERVGFEPSAVRRHDQASFLTWESKRLPGIRRKLPR
jgi:hypothetical protein